MKINQNTVLQGKRVTLVPYTSAHVPRYVAPSSWRTLPCRLHSSVRRGCGVGLVNSSSSPGAAQQKGHTQRGHRFCPPCPAADTPDRVVPFARSADTENFIGAAAYPQEGKCLAVSELPTPSLMAFPTDSGRAELKCVKLGGHLINQKQACRQFVTCWPGQLQPQHRDAGFSHFVSVQEMLCQSQSG